MYNDKKLTINDEKSWMYKGWQAFTEVNFVKNSMMYYVTTPEGTTQYLGANLSKKIVNDYIDHVVPTKAEVKNYES